MYDIIIIGAGPAGLTAGLYALRGNKKVLILESNSYGGKIINASSVENYPGILEISGFDYATNLYNQVKSLNGIIKYEKVTKVTKNRTVITNKNKYKTHSVIIATGSNYKRLELENETSLLGHGISYCATCDGNFFKDKIVAVVGGGNTALTDTLYLKDIAKKVYLIHRRDTFKCDNKYLNEVKKYNNIEIILNSNITKINGKDKLTSIVLNDNKVLDIDGLFIAIGQTPNNLIFKNVVDLDEQGYIITHNDVKTKTKYIYACGDNRKKSLRQLTTAVSDGSIASTLAIEELNDWSNYEKNSNCRRQYKYK